MLPSNSEDGGDFDYRIGAADRIITTDSRNQDQCEAVISGTHRPNSRRWTKVGGKARIVEVVTLQGSGRNNVDAANQL